MKKLYTYLILPVLVALCVSACSESSPAVPTIELQGGNELNIGAEGGSLNLRFQSTFPWSATSDESWCTLTTKSGEGGSISLLIEVKPNETIESRYANITLRSETVLCKVKVVQAPAVPAIELQGGNELNIGAEGGSLNLRFQSTFPWSATSDESWCTLTTKSGEGGSISLPIEVKPNETFESRYANITLRSETVLCKVKVVQAAHGTVTLVVKHTAPKFNIPVFTGASIRGTVTWGDGAQEDYQKGLSHEYAEQKEYTTTISITGVEAVELENISGIAEIDFTGF